MKRECVECLARIEGHSCHGVSAGDDCLSSSGPIYNNALANIGKATAQKSLMEIADSRGFNLIDAQVLQLAVREWLREVNIPELTDEARKMLVILVDEPS